MAFKSSTRGLSAAGSGDVSIDVPAGSSAGDLALVTVFVESDATLTPPAGFSVVSDAAGSPSNSQGRLVVFGRFLTAPESGSWGVGFGTNSAYREVNAFLFSGRSGSIPTPGKVLSPSGTSVVIPGVVAAAGADLVAIVVTFNGGATTPPPGFTEVHDFGDVTSVSTQPNVAAGATGTKTVTLANPGPAHGLLLALAPSSTGSPAPGSTGWQVGSIAC